MRPGAPVGGDGPQPRADPRVAQMLDHFTQYVGSSPDASPAVLCGIAHMQTGEGVWYPRGGTRACPRRWRGWPASWASSSAPGRGVRAILTDAGRRASPGVETDDGERVAAGGRGLERDARADPPRAAGRRRPRPRRFEQRRGYEPACSGVVLYLGPRPRATTTCSTTTSSSRATRTRSSTPSTARASRPPTRPATSAPRPRTEPGRRPARRRGALRPGPHALPAARTTTGRRCSPTTAG